MAAATIALIGSSAAAQKVATVPAKATATVDHALTETTQASPRLVQSPEVLRLSDLGPTQPGRAVRGSPPVGGSCQTGDNLDGFNYGFFATADNLNPSVTGAVTAVSWSAAYAVFVPALGNGTPPASESFRIRFYLDNAGVPGAQVGTDVIVAAPTRVDSGTTLNVGNPVVALTIYDYTAAIAGPVLNAGSCYWMEIRNTSVLAANNASFWITAAPLPGDAIAYASACGTYTPLDQLTNDLTWCVNLTVNDLDGLNCPIASTAPQCTSEAANGHSLDTSTDSGYSAVSPGSFYTNGTVRFQRAENFALATGGNLNQVCFAGFFTNQAFTAFANPCTKDFDLIIWNNVTATGLPGTVLAQRKVGTNGVTLERGLDARGNEIFTINLPAGQEIPLLANTCYHLTVSATLNISDPNRQGVFFWGIVPDALALPGFDAQHSARLIPINNGAIGPWVLARALPQDPPLPNISFQLNLGPVIPSVCLPPPPVNDTCAGATTLPLTGALVAGANVNGQPEMLPGTAFSLVEGPAVWYSFIGTGNDVTITTCNADSALDSVLHVYCAPNGCAGPFNRVGGNDDTAPICLANNFASTVTVPTISGMQYYVVVNGFGGEQNSFNISATQGAASNPVPTCDANCEISAEPFDVAETEVCNTGADTNGTCATPTLYPNLGDTAKGSISTSANSLARDVDMWRLPASANGATVVLALRTENPVLVQFLNDPSTTCTNIVDSNPPSPFIVVPNSVANIAACLPLEADLFEVTLPATGTNFFLITTPSFGGSLCALGLDEYRFEVRLPAIGACCLASTACFATTLTDCSAQSTGDPNDFWTNGIACTVNPCESQPGNCCLPDGTCQLVPSATIGNAVDCAAATGVYTAGGVCTPNTCPTAGNIACCRGSRCVLEPAAGCTGPNTFNSGAGACNAAGILTSPCCKADFNHVGGITVVDIFDFLTAYFTANPDADINETGGVSVIDIFDFLGGYFTRGCP